MLIYACLKIGLAVIEIMQAYVYYKKTKAAITDNDADP